jgi:hypothetical protein
MGVRKYPAQDSAFRTESLLHGFAESNSQVFNGMMLVHVQIAASVQIEIEGAVARDEFQHVVKEADAGGDASLAAPVQVQFLADVGLVCFAMNGGSAWLHSGGSHSL